MNASSFTDRRLCERFLSQALGSARSAACASPPRLRSLTRSSCTLAPLAEQGPLPLSHSSLSDSFATFGDKGRVPFVVMDERNRAVLDPRYLRYISLEAHAAAERPAPAVVEANEG